MDPFRGAPSEHAHRPLPVVEPIKVAPQWAAESGDRLIRLTQDQAMVGRDDPRFHQVDPFAALTAWFGPGDPATKLALEPSIDSYDSSWLRVFRPSWGRRRLGIDMARVRELERSVTFTLDGVDTTTVALAAFDQSALRDLRPMRDFARRLQQTNKPVSPWLHTVGHHVGAESHHERTFMTLADHHSAIDYIAGQPFTLAWTDGQALATHTPDVLLLGGASLPLVVDVKIPADAEQEKWVAKAREVRRLVNALGMGYLVWTGMSRPYRRNLENFTEARVLPDSYAVWSEVGLALCVEPTRASDLADHLDASGYQRLWALTLIRRMLWRRALRTDMYTPYSSSSMVEVEGG